MKKYYDAMYKIFNYYHKLLSNDVSDRVKKEWISELFTVLGGALDVAICDNEVEVNENWESLLNLRSHLCDIAEIYLLSTNNEE